MSSTFPHDYDDFNSEQAEAEFDFYEQDRAAGKVGKQHGL